MTAEIRSIKIGNNGYRKCKINDGEVWSNEHIPGVLVSTGVKNTVVVFPECLRIIECPSGVPVSVLPGGKVEDGRNCRTDLISGQYILFETVDGTRIRVAHSKNR